MKHKKKREKKELNADNDYFDIYHRFKVSKFSHLVPRSNC